MSDEASFCHLSVNKSLEQSFWKLSLAWMGYQNTSQEPKLLIITFFVRVKMATHTENVNMLHYNHYICEPW